MNKRDFKRICRNMASVCDLLVQYSKEKDNDYFIEFERQSKIFKKFAEVK